MRDENHTPEECESGPPIREQCHIVTIRLRLVTVGLRLIWANRIQQQECIPVGCITPAAVVVTGEEGVSTPPRACIPP